MRFTCVDSFSGAGGLCLGLQRAGYQVVLSFDNDPLCAETKYFNPQHFKNPVLTTDIADLLHRNLLKHVGMRRGELFLLAGGPPCQGFSIQRIGPDIDIRNNLVMQFVSLVDEVFPSYLLMENVQGIQGKRGSKILEQALKKLDNIGYWIHARSLDAQDFGIPQRRKRVFIVGERKDLGLPTFEFPTPITPENRRITVRNAIGHLPPPPSDGTDHPRIPHHRSDKLSELNKRRLLKLRPGQGREHLPTHLLSRCHRVDSSVIGHRNVYGRMAWDEVSPTITARFDSFTRGKFGHPEQTRSISLREGAILQTFPEKFLFAGNKVDIARQIGNAVPPKLAEILGRQILECNERKRQT